jgi:hypothetical protein
MTEDENKPAKINPVANSEATRFKPGQSGNPGGRPKGLFPVRIRRKLKRVIGKDENGEKVLRVDSVLDRAIEYAEGPDGLGHLNFIADHCDGKLATPKEEPTKVNQQQVVVLPSWSCADEASRPK